jgi:CubicO group peptidase (beta-lactamase class C family)
MRSPSLAPRLLCALLAGAMTLASTRAPAQPTVPAERLDRVFARYAGRATPGCAVGVGQAGQPVTARAYGMADLEHDVPLTPESIFEAGSVTKQVTAAAVVLLAVDGKLSLDDDVRKHVPELPDYGTPITIRHLLNHTSGLRDWGSVADLAGWPRTTRVYDNDIALDIAARQRALNYRPGALYSYTNSGYNLLAVIVGRVSGMPLARFSQLRLFEPLGMTRTSWRDDFARVVPGRAIAYQPARDTALARGAFRLDMPFENAYGNGGLLTTVGDLLRWTDNLETGTLGGPRFLAEMHRQGRLTDGREITYASGLVVDRYRGLREVSHSGATAGYRAWLGRYPDEKVTVAVLCNHAAANATALAHEAADLYLPPAAAVAAAPMPPGVAVTAEALQARAGAYRDALTGEVIRLVVAEGTLRSEGAGPLVARSRWSFQDRAGRTYAFDSTSAAGGRVGLRQLTPAGDRWRYEPVDDTPPTASQLAALAGTYASDEVETAYTVRVVDGTLRARGRFGPEVPLRPLYTDAFSAGGRTVRFVRDGSGRVTGLDMGNSRAWQVRFTKQPSGGTPVTKER